MHEMKYLCEYVMKRVESEVKWKSTNKYGVEALCVWGSFSLLWKIYQYQYTDKAIGYMHRTEKVDQITFEKVSNFL